MNNKFINLGGEVFSVLSILEKISVADSFVVSSNKIGGGNGEAKLYVGQRNDQIKEFFGERYFEVDAILSKHNLINYLDNSFGSYIEPTLDFRNKDELPIKWKERYQEIENGDPIINFKVKDQGQLGGPRVYINAFGEHVEAYSLLRKIPLPVISYINIYKIKDSRAKVFFYFTLHLQSNECSISETDNVDSNIEKFIPGNEDNSDVEKELQNDAVIIDIPFDPNKIKVRTTPSSIGQIINDLEDKIIDLDTEFQRLPNLWKEVKKSRFIESLLLKLPIPAFYFNEKEENDLEVIDGLQRISTIKSFVLDEDFSLKDLEFLKEYNGKYYSELPSTFQRRIKTFPITTYIIEKGTPDQVKYNIFKRVNTGGLTLTEQEIRHAINQGIPAELIADLARGEDEIDDHGEIRIRENADKTVTVLSATKEGKAFVKATDSRIGSSRMEDRDFITRFVSFYLINYSDYEPNLDTFLNKGMSFIKSLDHNGIKRLKDDFYSSMTLSYDIFKEDAFRKRFNEKDSRKPINKALFEVFSVLLAKLSSYQRAVLLDNSSLFKAKFIELHKDVGFLAAISQGTAKKENVIKRFKEIEKIIEESI